MNTRTLILIGFSLLAILLIILAASIVVRLQSIKEVQAQAAPPFEGQIGGKVQITIVPPPNQTQEGNDAGEDSG